jgi:hypothetical protein
MNIFFRYANTGIAYLVILIHNHVKLKGWRCFGLQISYKVFGKKNQPISLESMMKLCKGLGCDIGDIVAFIPDESEGLT